MENRFPTNAIEHISLGSLKPYPQNARSHSQKQIRQIADSIKRFGYLSPILIDEAGTILAGHGRVEAAKLLKLPKIPALRVEDMTEAEKKAYVIADNRLAELAGWDKNLLKVELAGLVKLEFDLELIGFDTPQIDLMFAAADERDHEPEEQDDLSTAMTGGPVVTSAGDVWLMGQGATRHRLLNGDARDPAAVALLMGDRKAAMAITDPPYNVKIQGHVRGKGQKRHGEFAMASGEMNEAEFIRFLTTTTENMMTASAGSAVVYMFMDWRHLFEALSATRSLGLTLINLCVWNKSNGGMGSLYRSKHELVLVLRQPDAQHRNNVQLGKNGRSRTNVWDYAGVNTFKAGRDEELAMHPTVKPAAMIADAIRDVSKQGDVVLDLFAGSGTIFIAAEKTGRAGFGTELDPNYCDIAVRRWQAFTGRQAVLADTGETFDEVGIRRAGTPPGRGGSDRPARRKAKGIKS